jgi:hypothetical protein
MQINPDRTFKHIVGISHCSLEYLGKARKRTVKHKTIKHTSRNNLRFRQYIYATESAPLNFLVRLHR